MDKAYSASDSSLETVDSLDDSILSVSALTFQIKSKLRAAFSPTYVQGEISNLKKQSSGHWYFSLKDTSAQLSCALFKGSASKLSFIPKEGDEVVVMGNIDVYAPRGQYQLIASSMRIAGLGALLQKLQKLKEELKALGYFDSSHKKPLPSFPQKIAVITSPTGSVIRDIIHVLKRRALGFHLIVSPVSVQGELCPSEVCFAIEEINRHKLADVIIVARGGGSIEDLSGFNSKVVAEAIFKSHIPIISAIGHETDTTIADCVADKRAPTPSAAAEIVLEESTKHLKFLEKAHSELMRSFNHKLLHTQTLFSRYTRHPLLNTSDLLLAPFFQKTDQKRLDLSLAARSYTEKKMHALQMHKERLKALRPKAQVRTISERLSRMGLSIRKKPPMLTQKAHTDLKKILEQLLLAGHERKSRLRLQTRSLEEQQKNLHRLFTQKLEKRRLKLKALCDHLEAVDPRSVLKKGYALIFSQKEGSIILSKEALVKEGAVTIRMHDGEAFAQILDNQPKSRT